MARILVVDDVQSNIDVLDVVLTDEGHEIITAQNGEICLRQALQKDPDLILLDMHMPGLDGIETCTRIKADHKLRDIPVIMVSADNQDETIIKGLVSGANDYVVKPFKFEILIARVDAALRLRRSIIIQQRLADQIIHSEKMVAVGQLAVGIAHEINNPMSFILSNLSSLAGSTNILCQALAKYKDLTLHLIASSEQLQQEAKDTLAKISAMDLEFLSNDCPELIQDCLKGGERIKHIVQDLAHLHNINNPDPELVDLPELLEELIQTTSPQRQDRIPVVLDLEDVQSLVCLRNNLYEVFLDIILNAIQAIHGQGRIWLRVTQGERGIYCEIQDNGVGIEPQRLSRIFDPFYTTHDVGQGIGLGLYKCYRIVKSMGGDLSVKSQVDEGTKFTIFFPLNQ